MLFMGNQQERHLMEDKPENLLVLVQTHFMEEIKMEQYQY